MNNGKRVQFGKTFWRANKKNQQSDILTRFPNTRLLKRKMSDKLMANKLQ